jgi:glycosyltransferase involved in cell wall biosynthesis/peptidoglycan/xylan/chitin deacetylase (PgdA/CDA1 family)/SAM-dependent methyltransferase
MIDDLSSSPSVSIVIPAYNAGQTLAATLASVEQLATADWEAIVIDDGSTDDTASIIADRAACNQRIVSVQGEHRGVSAARNAGILRARGEWVIFLDADDRLPPHHLERLLAAASSAPDATLVHAGWRRLAPDGRLLSAFPAEPLADPFATCSRMCPFAIHSAMTRRTALEEIGGFDETLSICEDWDLWQRLARAGARFVAAPDHLVDVRMRPGSVSSDPLALLKAGLGTIDRAFAPDPRVPFDKAHRAADEHTSARTNYILWNLGNVIGRHADLDAALATAGRLDRVGTVELDVAANVLVDGLVAGVQRPIDDWQTFWPGVEADFRKLIARIDEGTGAHAGGWLQAWVERRVLWLLRDAKSLSVGAFRSMEVELDAPLPDLALPEHVDRLRLTLTQAGVEVGTYYALVQGVAPLERLAKGALGPAAWDAVRNRWSPPEAAVTATGRRWFARMFAKRDRSGKTAKTLDPARVLADPTEALIALAAAKWRRSANESGTATADWSPPDYASVGYWEGFYKEVDPWGYENSYDAEKYRQTLELIASEPVGQALEIGCAEGHFTRKLAACVDRLHATDISATAVERAAERCRDLSNLSFAPLDLARAALPAELDLIVCSEVLYYQPDQAALAGFAEKVVGSLNEGGRLVLAHGNLLADEPDQTGFPWPHRFGAKAIGELLGEHPQLHLEHEIWTPLYRIQAFRRSATGKSPERKTSLAARRLPRRVAAQVRWRGGREVPVADAWSHFPILMYHRIAAEGPDALARYRVAPSEFEAQLSLLRRAGWQGLTMDRLIAAVQDRKPVPPQTVMLTFDDAYVDFLDEALPLLHRYGFPAALFVPVGKVGQCADWDARHGLPAPILDWRDLAMLRHCDVTLGAHGYSHAALPSLSAKAQLGELAEARGELGYRLDEDIAGVAYPFGEFDPAVLEAAKRCGYRVGMTCEYGWVGEETAPLRLPRVEIGGDLSIEQFADLLGIRS